MSTNTNRVPADIIALLEEGLQLTRMSTASFPNPGIVFDALSADEYTAEVKESTRVYRESWVEPPLAIVLAYLKGEITADQARGLYGVDPQGWSRHVLDDDIRNPLTLLGAERLAKKEV